MHVQSPFHACITESDFVSTDYAPRAERDPIMQIHALICIGDGKGGGGL